MPRLNPHALTFGTFTSSYPPVAQVIQSAQALEAAGFDHVWAGDQLQFQHPHRLWTPEYCDGANVNPKLAAKFALQPLMSVIGQHTRRVCIGQGVLDAIRRGPAILAQEFLTTQHFTQGRAIFVLAAGEWKNIGPYGYDHRLRDSKLVETARLVRAFLETQEPISYDGRFWKLEDAVVELPPFDGVPPPLWLAGGGPKVLEAVGRWADGWVVYTPGGVGGRPEAIAEKLAVARGHAAAAGRDPNAITVRDAAAHALPSRPREGRGVARPPVHAVARAHRFPLRQGVARLRPRPPARRRLVDHARGQHGGHAARPRPRPLPSGCRATWCGTRSMPARPTTSSRVSSPR
jgi:alkanesulfonate monooxygenase SsuD/methylene tetrahydromethanopterin reductase-like flavin-dependent oxidoreductase (luciferase family)